LCKRGELPKGGKRTVIGSLNPKAFGGGGGVGCKSGGIKLKGNDQDNLAFSWKRHTREKEGGGNHWANSAKSKEEQLKEKECL